MKKITMITASKGGAGKSTLCWLFCQKYPNTMVLDMDDATTTSMKQLAYLNPKKVSFLNSNNTIDRGKFNDFLEYISTHAKDNFICDLGASLAEQLPFYFTDIGVDALKDGLDALNIELEIICLVGGQNIFAATMNYLHDLLVAVNNKLNVKIAINDYYLLNELQEQEFISFVNMLKINKQNIFHFDLSKDKNQTTQQKINTILRNGEGLKNAGVFTKLSIQNSIQNFPL